MSLIYELGGRDYPSEAGLEQLRSFTGTPHELADILEATFGRMGTVSITEGVNWHQQPVMIVYLATGGWSGNEEMISALEKSAFWFMYWQSSARGGAFTFHVRMNRWDQKLPEWTR